MIGLSVQRANVEPVSLQPSRVASKKFVLVKVQPTNAVASWTEALNRHRSKMQSSNVAPLVRGLGEVDLGEPDALVAHVGQLVAVPVLAADLARCSAAQTSKVPPLRQYQPSSRVRKSFSTR